MSALIALHGLVTEINYTNSGPEQGGGVLSLFPLKGHKMQHSGHIGQKCSR